MSTGSEYGGEPGGGRAPTEEELRAEYEAQIKQVRVEHVLLENVVTLANLGLRRTGLAPGTEDERDPEQVRMAIEAIRTLMPLLEESMPEQAAQIKDALSQLQFAFVKIGGAEIAPGSESRGPSEGAPEEPQPGEAPTEPPQPEQPSPDDPGPAQRSGRLWVPGQ
jgi:hypothetical protein